VSLGLPPAASTWPGQGRYLQSTVGQGFLKVGLRPGWACGKGDRGLELEAKRDWELERSRAMGLESWRAIELRASELWSLRAIES
jgi:hypothetical protein